MTADSTFDFPHTFRSLTLNGHRKTDGTLNAGAAEKDTYRVERFDPSRVQMRDQREPLHLIPGGDLGDASKTFRYLSIGGTLIASTQAKLDDSISAMLQTFDIDECQLAFPSTEGVSPYSFYSVTEIAGYAGVVHERFYVRPAGFPAMGERRSTGLSIPFALELVCADPRRYLDTAEAVTLNSGNGFASTCPNWNTLVGVHVFPTITITMVGVGSSSFSIDVTGDQTAALVLDLSLLHSGNVVTVDTNTGRILVDGGDRADLRTSGVETARPYVPRGGGAVAATNTTNVSSVVIAYRQARG